MRASLRRPFLGRAASILAVLAGIGLLAGAEAGVGLGLGVTGYGLVEDNADGIVMDETTGSIGRTGGSGAELPLSDEDRFHIYEGVMRIPDAPVAKATPPEVADALPGEVKMQDLPPSVIRQIPRVEGHKFVKFDDRILVVEPASRLVVAMIPRYKLMP